jgi:hypothetical protein
LTGFEYWFKPHKVYIEFPTFHFRGNIKSVLKLAFLIGRLVERTSGEVTLVPVAQWRGTLPKSVLWRRAERFFKVKGLNTDQGDAVALGMFLIRKYHHANVSKL